MFGFVIQPAAVALHRNRIEFAADIFVRRCKHAPHLVVYGMFPICTLAAEDGVLRIPMMKEILRGKDVGTRGVRRFRAVGGELREKIIVVGAALRAREESIKECSGAFIVMPKYCVTVGHHISFGGGNASPLFAIPRRNARTRG